MDNYICYNTIVLPNIQRECFYMSRFKKYIVSVLSLTVAFSLTLCNNYIGTQVLGTSEVQDYSNVVVDSTSNFSNELHGSMPIYSSPVYTYLQNNNDGTISKVVANSYVDGYCNNIINDEVSNPKTVSIDTYGTDYSLKGSVTLPMELDMWGGYYCGTTYNYCIFGQKNLTQDDNAEVIRVVKYSKDWQRLDSVSICGSNTIVPFDGGTPRMVEANGTLYIHLSHQMYAVKGVNHQANCQLYLDANSLEVKYKDFSILSYTYNGYVSHSFDQYVQADEQNVYTVDLGDALPRSVLLCKKDTEGNLLEYTNALDISGSVGNNYTGVTLGGFELSDDNCILVGNSIVQDGSVDSSSNVRNIFVSVTDKSLNSTTVKYLTDYTTEEAVSKPQLVKIDNDNFIAMWNEYSQDGSYMHAVKLNGKGEVVLDITTNAIVSDCKPIIVGDNLVWYLTDGNDTTFYQIDYKKILKYTQPIVAGDVNEDGKVDGTDLYQVSQYILDSNSIAFSEQGLLNADTNQDDVIDVADLFYISYNDRIKVFEPTYIEDGTLTFSDAKLNVTNMVDSNGSLTKDLQVKVAVSLNGDFEGIYSGILGLQFTGNTDNVSDVVPTVTPDTSKPQDKYSLISSGLVTESIVYSNYDTFKYSFCTSENSGIVCTPNVDNTLMYVYVTIPQGANVKDTFTIGTKDTVQVLTTNGDIITPIVSNGTISFIADSIPPTNQDTMLGDLNLDGSVKTNDLLILKKYLLGLKELDGQAYINADVNQDGKVASNDLLRLKKYFV